MSKTPHHRSINPRLRTFAKDMRGDSTDAETKMWQLLRGRRLSQFKFRRQAPIENYILDFVCFEKRLVVEIDGGQHASSTRDVIRDQMLASLGFIVAAIGTMTFCKTRHRFWTICINDF